MPLYKVAKKTIRTTHQEFHITADKQRRRFCELSNDKFPVSKTVERAQPNLLLSFNIALSKERVSLFAYYVQWR
jgi:hypothetical protein